jgi:hypothetical protein
LARAGGEPLQLHREQQDQKNRKPEIRDCDAELRHRHHADIADLVVIGGGVDAGGQRQHDRQQHRHHRQRDGERQPLGDKIRYRRAVGIAVAEIADQEPADPVQVTDDQRLVEPKLDRHGADRLRRRIGAHQHLGSVTRQRIKHEKDDQRGARQRCHQRQKASEDKETHALFPLAPSSVKRNGIRDHPTFGNSIQ